MVPFDAEKLQRLMGDHPGGSVDAVLATTRHNVRYLTGGYHVPFHARTRRFGGGQYLAVVGVPRDVRTAFYVGRRDHVLDESAYIDVFGGIWIEDRQWFDRGRGMTGAGMTVQAAEQAAAALRKRGLAGGTLAVELPFLPADAFETLRRELPEATFVDATPILGELRAVKRPEEIELIRRVHLATAEAIRATLAALRPEQTTRELAERVRLGMEERGAAFLYCFTNVGPGLLRAASDLTCGAGRPVHLDAGAELRDYASDVARMGSVGQPPAEALGMYAACLDAQDRVCRAAAAGVACGELQRLGEEVLRSTPWGEHSRVVLHGMGMVSHEPPHVTADSTRPLEAGMILSVETEYRRPGAGHIKFEDSVAVTPTGCEVLGDDRRDWCVAG